MWMLGGNNSRESTGLRSKLESGTGVERRARKTRSSAKWTKQVANVRRMSPERDACHDLGMRPGLKDQRPSLFRIDEC